MFDKIINWKLLAGSHDFPGPDGGTCINEAAIIAAGFEYKKVGSAHDCPPCFSRVIAQYAIGLNDRMPEDLRQELLMPFVTRLSGTADVAAVEKKRMDFIVLETVRRINAHICRKAMKREDLAIRCEAVETIQEAKDLAQEIRKAARAYADDAAAAAYAADAADAAAAAAAAAYAAYAAAAAAAAYAAYAAAAAAAAAADDAADAADAAADADARKEIWVLGVSILDGAIKLGNQAKEEDREIIISRLEKSKHERASV